MINFQFTVRVEKCRQLNTPTLRNLLTREIRAKHATESYICFEDVFQPTIAKLLLNMPVDVKTVNPNAWVKLPKGLSDEALKNELEKIMEGFTFTSMENEAGDEFEPTEDTPFDEKEESYDNEPEADPEIVVPVEDNYQPDDPKFAGNEINTDETDYGTYQPENSTNYTYPILDNNDVSDTDSQDDSALNAIVQAPIEEEIQQPQKNTVVIQRNNKPSNNQQQYHNNNQNKSNYRK